MRASRETELAKQYPIHVVTKWLGNTPRIALKHYLQVTDADFDKASEHDSESGAKSGVRVAQKAAQPTFAEIRHDAPKTTQAPVVTGACANSGEPRPVVAKCLNGEDRIQILPFRNL